MIMAQYVANHIVSVIKETHDLACEETKSIKIHLQMWREADLSEVGQCWHVLFLCPLGHALSPSRHSPLDWDMDG